MPCQAAGLRAPGPSSCLTSCPPHNPRASLSLHQFSGIRKPTSLKIELIFPTGMCSYAFTIYATRLFFYPLGFWSRSTKRKIPTDKHKRTASGRSLHAFTFPGWFCCPNSSGEGKAANFHIQDATEYLYTLKLQQEATSLFLQKQSL